MDLILYRGGCDSQFKVQTTSNFMEVAHPFWLSNLLNASSDTN